MNLYTLTPGFMPKDIVSEFISVVWTERYFEAGDVQLVTPATPDMIKKLAHGTFLGLRGTQEVMILDTQSIEDELLTVTGKSLLKFLDERQAWFENPDPSADQGIVALTSDTTAGELISSAVDMMVVNPIEFVEGPANQLNLNWDREKIPGLGIGRVDANGGVKRLTINLGKLYNSIQSVAQEEGLGLKLYLESSSWDNGPVLKFATYRGKNRTSQQSTHALVRLTPKMDSLTGVKEISSSTEYKNVVYVVYHGMSIYYAEPSLPIPEGFNRRVLVVQAEDIYLDPEKHQAYRDQVAHDTFANNDYIRTVDGQAAPQGIYQFSVDYYLGDIIELEGVTGTLAKARITEYIRSQDKTGEREYPTLSVVDHLSTGMIPDTEPDPIEPPGDGDPDFDPDPDPVPEPPDTEDEDPEVDPNEDPRPELDPPPDPPPPPPTTLPPQGEPTPEPIVLTFGEDPVRTEGDAVVYEAPISDMFGVGYGYYELRVTSNIEVKFEALYMPGPLDADHPDSLWALGYSGMVFQIWNGDRGLMGADILSGHFDPEVHNYYQSPYTIDSPLFTSQFIGSHGIIEVNPYDLNILEPFSLKRWFRGPAVWEANFGLEEASNQWIATANPGDITFEFVWHPY